jgi:hypothetical protein
MACASTVVPGVVSDLLGCSPDPRMISVLFTAVVAG